jgi:acyl-CoA dehydrogenase
MAVRTGPPGSGAAGISLLVVPLKGQPGVTMRRLSVSGTASSGTTYIELDDVRVPLDNLLGDENQGMRYIMTNFNHERLAVATGATRQARVALSTAFEYVLKREAFGRPLVDQPVVRHRLAKVGALLESLTAWVEQFAYMMTRLPHQQADVLLGGPTALLKAQAGMVFKECADTAVLLFGGNGYTRTGQGQLVESEYFERHRRREIHTDYDRQCSTARSWVLGSPADPRMCFWI